MYVEDDEDHGGMTATDAYAAAAPATDDGLYIPQRIFFFFVAHIAERHLPMHTIDSIITTMQINSL